MGIAESMKGLTEDILASYDVRVKALGDIVADTHKIVADARKTIKGFASDRKKMSAEQAEALANYAKDLVKNVEGMLKEFSNSLSVEVPMLTLTFVLRPLPIPTL